MNNSKRARGPDRREVDQVIEKIRSWGWCVAIPEGPGDEPIAGFACGDKEYFQGQWNGEHDVYEPAKEH